jgi:hypothetical protein
LEKLRSGKVGRQSAQKIQFSSSGPRSLKGYKHQAESVTNSTTNGAEELARRVEGIVSEHWVATRKAMLLTALGKAIREKHTDLVDYMRPTLRRFIEESHAANIITHPDFFQTQGAIPLTVSVPSDLRPFFDNKKPGRVSRFGASSRVLPGSFSTYGQRFEDLPGLSYCLIPY